MVLVSSWTYGPTPTGIEAIILGWGLTAALISLLIVSPLALVLPDMLWKFLYPKGGASVLYLLAVTCCDASFDILSLVIISQLGMNLVHLVPCSLVILSSFFVLSM